MKPANFRIMTINGGSSSIKFALFAAGDSLRWILWGRIERVGRPEAALNVKGSNPLKSLSLSVVAHPDIPYTHVLTRSVAPCSTNL